MLPKETDRRTAGKEKKLMSMESIASGVTRIPLAPLDLINVYLIDGVLVDSGVRMNEKALLAALDNRPPSALALTHAHVDHQGCAHAVCERYGIPLACGAADREVVESGRLRELMPASGSLMARLSERTAGPAHPVDQVLAEGDSVGSFTVLETPGHTLGHLSFWRQSDRVLILGDVLFNRSPVTLLPGLTEPLRGATMDPALNRRSARRVADLAPAVVCFGHGAPLRDPARLKAFVEKLPQR